MPPVCAQGKLFGPEEFPAAIEIDFSPDIILTTLLIIPVCPRVQAGKSVSG
jgi:hypothetical protein